MKMTSVRAIRSSDKTSSKDSSTSSRCSSRGIKRKSFFDEAIDLRQSNKKPVRPCERSGCPASIPICFANSTDKCVGSGYTSRWHHISAGEHFCNECFEYFYRSHKSGYETFCKWKRDWCSKGKAEASICVFLADNLLPFWVQCTRSQCQKWRQLSRDVDFTPDFIRKFKCGMTSEGKTKEKQLEACAVPEDHRVEMCQTAWWLGQLTASVGLKMSPSIYFLSDYSPDAIGHCPTDSTYLQPWSDKNSTYSKVWEMLRQPFTQPDEADVAYSVKPDEMSEPERKQFPHFAKEPKIFLSLRNLIISLWNLNIKEWLTWQRCACYLVYRGVTRIKCAQELRPIIYYLTRKGYINIGLLREPPPSDLLLPNIDHQKNSVLIIGAGIAGLAAARQLTNFGVKVTVLEAQNWLGGRVGDQSRNGGINEGYGAQIINGCVNNPICLMCMQADIEMKVIRDKYELIFENGELALQSSCRRLNFHFNALLDVVAEWRKDKVLSKDTGLLSKFQEAHAQFLEQSQLEFSPEEEKILQYYLGHMELVSGCSVEELSAMHWDQHEAFPQLGTSSILLSKGASQLLNLLSEELDIQYNVEVMKIDYNGMGVMVHASSGGVFKADKRCWIKGVKQGGVVSLFGYKLVQHRQLVPVLDLYEDHQHRLYLSGYNPPSAQDARGSLLREDYKVLVTVPLAVLQKDFIEFVPPLPAEKAKAIKSLGAGLVEMVVLQFKRNFWKEKVKDVDVFGHIASDESCRGLFSVFYDLSRVHKSGKESHILVTYLAGNGLKKMSGKTSKQIVDACMEVLCKLFPEQKVPRPNAYYTSHWQKDRFSQMSYSYIPVGVDASVYSHIAEEVQEKVYFAGEATCSKFPQSMSGAYWSGLREAEKILDSLECSKSPTDSSVIHPND